MIFVVRGTACALQPAKQLAKIKDWLKKFLIATRKANTRRVMQKNFKTVLEKTMKAS